MHLVILPYYCEEEVRRYEEIAAYLFNLHGAQPQIEFLLSSLSSMKSQPQLEGIFERIAPVKTFRVQTEIESYPQRPTVMFWETMEFVQRHYEADGGFVLWLESDMLPVRAGWVRSLEGEWQSRAGLLLMGRHVPCLNFRGASYVEHINGGACYAKHFAEIVSPENRGAPFDLTLFESIQPTGRWLSSAQFDFSTPGLLARDIQDERKTILHGYKQDKDLFIRQGIQKSLRHHSGLRPRWRESLPLLAVKPCCEASIGPFWSRTCPLH